MGMSPCDPDGTGAASGSVEDVTILLVDDDETWGRTTARLLERQRDAFDVTTAHSVAAGREAYPALDPDCVVCDYKLDDGTGLDLLRRVRGADPDRPFVLVTGEGDERVASEAIHEQVTDYVRKKALGGGSDLLARRVTAAVRSYRTERALDRERRSKEAMLDIVTATTSRDGLSRAFCHHLVGERGYACAWIGTYDAAGGIVPQSTAGRDGYLDAAVRPGTTVGETDEPALVALDRREVHVVDRIDPPADRSTDDRGGDSDGADRPRNSWRRAAREQGFRSAAAVPIAHDGTPVGVLAVYASGPAAVGDRERDLLAEYGRTIGYALKATGWKQSLLAAAPVTVEFEVRDERAPLVALGDRLDAAATVEVPSAVLRDDGTVFYLARLADATPESVETAADAVAGVAAVEFADDDEPLRCELTATTPTPESVLADAGGQFRGTVVRRGVATVTMVCPGDRDVRPLVDALTSTFPDATAATVRSDGPDDDRLAPSALVHSLTDRQRQALELAFHEGYFERPRGRNATELAERLGVSRATFTQHLRAAERKLLGEVVEGRW